MLRTTGQRGGNNAWKPGGGCTRRQGCRGERVRAWPPGVPTLQQVVSLFSGSQRPSRALTTALGVAPGDSSSSNSGCRQGLPFFPRPGFLHGPWAAHLFPPCHLPTACAAAQPWLWKPPLTCQLLLPLSPDWLCSFLIGWLATLPVFLTGQ